MSYEYFKSGLLPNLNVEANKDVAKNEVDNELNLYKKYLEEGTIFDIQFTRCNRESGDFYKEIGDVTIYMSSEESITPATKNRRLANKLLTNFQVVVLSIDESKRVVTVSHKDAIRRLKNQLQRKMNKELKRADRNKDEEKIILPAKVVAVDKIKNIIIVDIYGYGIPGYVSAAQWQHLFTKDVGRFATVGSIVDVEVLFYNASAFGNSNLNMYCCSRKNLLKNPWDGIEDKYHVKDIVRIKCIDKQKKHWFGVIEGLDGIQVFCEYPDASNRITNVKIALEREYEGYIYSVSEEKMLLKARVFKEI